MLTLSNIHDKFFKETFSDVAVTKDFLSHYLPEAIQQYVDLNTIDPQKDSFIDEKLKESFSDLLFQVNIQNEEGYLYFLFEHKSSPEKGIPLQLLKYSRYILIIVMGFLSQASFYIFYSNIKARLRKESHYNY